MSKYVTKKNVVGEKTIIPKGSVIVALLPMWILNCLNNSAHLNGCQTFGLLGMANGINLQMVGNKAATTGDLVLIGSEVNPVVKALVEHGINVTAVHSHMLYESPRLFFLHFWGYDEPEQLAKGLKAALAKINLAK